jgi:hypothetical protein
MSFSAVWAELVQDLARRRAQAYDTIGSALQTSDPASRFRRMAPPIGGRVGLQDPARREEI